MLKRSVSKVFTFCRNKQLNTLSRRRSRVNTDDTKFFYFNKSCPLFSIHSKSISTLDLSRVNVIPHNVSCLRSARNHIHTTCGLQKGKKKSSGHISDSDSDSDESDEEFEHYEEDAVITTDAKEREIIVSSLRVDNVLANTVGTNRTTTEEEFYENKIRVNGRMPRKKALQVSDGDYIDRIVSDEGDQYRMQRVRLLKVKSERTAKKNKVRVICRTWLKPFLIDKHLVDKE